MDQLSHFVARKPSSEGAGVGQEEGLVMVMS